MSETETCRICGEDIVLENSKFTRHLSDKHDYRATEAVGVSQYVRGTGFEDN